jgi:hypothetical protein
MDRSVVIAAPAERVFAYVDDIRNMARHMSEERSMAMMGSRLTLEIVTPEVTGIGATYRYFGRMMGLTLDFSETVTRYVPGREKGLRTIGDPRLLIIGGYEMGVNVQPLTEVSCRLTITFGYDLPRAGLWRIVGWALAPWYGRWCLDSMTQGAKRELERVVL